MNRVAIIGAGLMGHGLAVVFADGGHEVSITDVFPDVLASAKKRVAETLKSLGKGEAAADRVTAVATLEEAARTADIIIEAAPEKLELKQRIFADLEAAAPRRALLCSNTSVIPIRAVAARVTTKDRVLGTHWWNPPYVVPLVEVIETEGASPESVQQMISLLRGLGKVAVHVKKDVPGFVGNRLQHALWREAISLVERGVCDAETVDLVVQNSFGRRLAVLGPLANADLVGTDLTLDIHKQVLADLESSGKPSPYLEDLVAAGRLGFKSNQGFMSWDEEKKKSLRAKVMEHLRKFL
ncbi:MAG: NAD(P)-binding domain-containing protein [Alphaproteobacteria bacterium]|nr:NAD(P)-binding domain-containing protein [Alphaproteobacteria bacterium]